MIRQSTAETGTDQGHTHPNFHHLFPDRVKGPPQLAHSPADVST